MVEVKNWRQMIDSSADLLARRTGVDLPTWNARVLDSDIADEPALRRWLSDQGLDGYAQMIVVMERFGYPDFMLADADELIDAQYADRVLLRPILDRLLLAAQEVGSVTAQARKSYVGLLTSRRQFAVIKASTRARVDLGLRLDAIEPHGRLQPARRLANDTINLRIELTTADEVDNDVVGWLSQAYDGSC